MSKKVIKIAILLVIFLISVVGFSLLTDTGNIDLTTEMAEATLPVVYLKNQDTYMNRLYGYRGEMDPMTMRDTITPLGEDLKLPLTVRTYQFPVDSISYTVRTMDMKRLLEETEVTGFSQKDGLIETQLQIQNLLETGEEYVLTITLGSGKDEVSYYTRIIRPEENYVDQSLAFVLDFHNKTFDKEKASELAVYLEPNQEGDNTTLQTVTIHSSLNQVTWGEFKGNRLEEPIPSIKEVNSSFQTIVLNYVMASKGEGGELEYYNVEEYFRVRYRGPNERMSLLDYQRTMNEIFRGTGADFTENAVRLGIRNADISYMSNESGTIICFVQEGELWGYNCGGNQLSLMYGFRGAEGMNDRENNPNHDIRIMKVDEAGSVDFVVYGYMNRGAQEGRTGIGVYHYDSVANTIEEELFVSSDKAYQVLKEDWGRLFYISDEGSFYMIGEDTLYRMDLKSGKSQKVLTGLNEDNSAVSEDGRYIAYRDSSRKNLITVTDLEGEVRKQIEAGGKEIVKPIGFVQSDFAYGTARQSDVKEENFFPMYKVSIVDENQQLIKEYEKQDIYVTGSYVENETIFMQRMWKNGEQYTPVETETLKSHEAEADQVIQVDTEVNEVKQTQVLLTVAQTLSDHTPQVLTPKEIVVKKKKIVELQTKPAEKRYYVFAGGKVIMCTGAVEEAIQSADKYAGVVIGEEQKYIWCRGRQAAVSIADKAVLDEAELGTTGDLTARCLVALLRKEGISLDVEGLIRGGESPEKILKEAMPEAMVLDLTGCTVSQVLYYVSCGNAVYTVGENGEPLLIVGYDEHNTILYDPNTNMSYKKGQKDSEAFFNNAGNVFIGYLK